MSYKVVANTCYGGFGLSEEAMVLYYERKGVDPNEVLWSSRELVRHDPDLIAVIEELGEEKSSGFCAQLKVVEINTPLYRINEYDGMEWVETPDSDSFILIDTQEKLECGNGS